MRLLISKEVTQTRNKLREKLQIDGFSRSSIINLIQGLNTLPGFQMTDRLDNVE